MKLSTRRSTVVAGILLVSLLGSEVAWAKPPAAPPPPPPPPTAPPPAPPAAPPSLAESLTGDAKADYDTAVIVYGDKDYAGAFLKFSNAYDKSKDPRLLWNMATCQKQLRHYARVIDLVQRYLAEGGDKISAADRKDGEDLIAALEPLTSKVTITVTEPGAEIFIDGESIGKSPLPAAVRVDVGTRKLHIVKADFEDSDSTFIPEGASKTIDVKLVPVSHEGRLVVTTQSDGAIALDGKPLATGSFSGPVAAGPHVVRVTAPKYVPYQVELNLAARETRSLSITLEREKGISPWVFVGIGAGAAVVAAVTVILVFALQPSAPLPVGTLSPYTLNP